MESCIAGGGSQVMFAPARLPQVRCALHDTELFAGVGSLESRREQPPSAAEEVAQLCRQFGHLVSFALSDYQDLPT